MSFTWPIVIAAMSGDLLKLGPTQEPLRRVLTRFDFATQISQCIVPYSEREQNQHGLLKVFLLQIDCSSSDLPSFLTIPIHLYQFNAYICFFKTQLIHETSLLSFFVLIGQTANSRISLCSTSHCSVMASV